MRIASVGSRLLAAAAVVSVALVSGIMSVAPASATRTERIIGGDEIPITDAPWQVALISADQNYGTVHDGQFCGGSIINERWIITAAHCLSDYRGSFLGVFAGNNDLDVSTGTDVYTASSWKVHPDYNGDDVWYNDLALVRLQSTLDLADPAIDPIAFPTAIDPADAPAVGDSIDVSGWGSTASPTPDYPTLLHGTTLDVISSGAPDACGDYATSDWNSLYETCIGIDGGGKDTCWGDSGGPYVDEIDADGDGETEPTLIGVTSWGEGCADANYPGFATRVTSYLDWIVPRSPDVNTAEIGANTVVSWSPLSNQFLSYPVSGYRVEYSLDSGETWDWGGTVTAKKRLLQVYGVTGAQWRLAALNAVNASGGPYLWSGDTDVDEARLGAAPDSPESFEYLGRTRSGYAFQWEQPNSVNGSAIWDYRIYQQRSFGSPRLAESGRSQWPTATVKSKFGRGTYWVVAVNNFGESAPSDSLVVP